MLDTKLKSNNKKLIINLIVAALLLVTSIGMVCVYPKMGQRANDFKENAFEDNYFLRTLYESSYVLYNESLINTGGNEEDVLNSLLKTDSYINSSKESRIIRSRDILQYWNRDLKKNMRNLDYYVVYNNEEVIMNTKNKLDVLLKETEYTSEVEKLTRDYSFYVTLEFDDKGKISVINSRGVDSKKVENELNIIQSEVINYNGIYFEPIKNMKFVYAVPIDMMYEDAISYRLESYESRAYISAGKSFIIGIIAVIILCLIVIPFRITREIVGLKKIFKIPLEISIFLTVIIIGLTCVGLEELLRETISGAGAIDFSNIIISWTPSQIGLFIANSLLWLMIFTIIFMETMYIKNIFVVGILKYLKENTIISIGYRKICKVVEKLSDIDLKEKNTKTIMILLGGNLLIMIIMCSMWVFGILFSIIYSVILFNVIRKYYYKVSSDYNKVIEATSKIASGNLDVEINDNVGIFESYKHEIQSIQTGFKAAVIEEVKSQNMKTELISNVSHDLKTPLTSIITYIDLLKSDNLTEEKRKLYLDTLDRKSLRLQSLIEDLFEVSKATSGNISLNIEQVDVVSLMKETLLELGDKLEEASLTVKSNFPENKVLLQLDSQRSFRVFENLVINITKYSMPGSRVYIDILDNEEDVEIILKNMAAEEIQFNPEEIVERFVRGDKSRNTQGSGLGLAIAKSFTDIQGGELTISVDGDLFKVTMRFVK